MSAKVNSPLDTPTDEDPEVTPKSIPGDPGAVVLFSSGRPEHRIVPIGDVPVVFGRQDCPADRLLSRAHVRISRVGPAFSVEDLNSRNGTYVGGERLARALVPANATVRIGGTLLWLTHKRPAREGPVVDEYGVVGPLYGASLEQAARVGAASGNLLISGESGSGKERVARAFHESGPQRGGRLVGVNCAAIPEHLAESLLFGSVRGAYTGSTQDGVGFMGEADAGTLFLDEIGELSLANQAKLLRVIETGELFPVGAARPRRVRVRICAASLRDLRRAPFRPDLFYRLATHRVRVPPLRERITDIPWIIDWAVRRQHPGVQLHAGFIDRCLQRSWPGNVRELLSSVSDAAVSAMTAENAPTVIEGRHLPDDAGKVAGDRDGLGGLESIDETRDEADPDSLMRSAILSALEQTRWRVSGEGGAARLLGFKPSTLESRMKRLGIERKPPRTKPDEDSPT